MWAMVMFIWGSRECTLDCLKGSIHEEMHRSPSPWRGEGMKYSKGCGWEKRPFIDREYGFDIGPSHHHKGFNNRICFDTDLYQLTVIRVTGLH